MVVIIGATGFIGMYTTEAFLKKGEDVVATGRNKLLGKKLEEMGAKFVELDITQKEDFQNFQRRMYQELFCLLVYCLRMQRQTWRQMKMQQITLRLM